MDVQIVAPTLYVTDEPWGVDTDDDIARRRFAALAGARHRLTRQEADCCYHLLRGLSSDKEIAAAMHAAHSTVKNMMSRVHDALGVSGREQIALTLWPLYRRARAAAGGMPCSTG